MSTHRDDQLPDLHPAAASSGDASAPLEADEHGQSHQLPPFVAARQFEGRVAPGLPWSAKVRLDAASRVGVHVRSDVDAEYMVQFTDAKGRELFPTHRAPQSTIPAWFHVPKGVVRIAVSFPGNYARMASITVWLPSEIAGTPGQAA